MKKIGGNTQLVLKYERITTNDIGEQLQDWVELQTLNGFLDLMNQTKNYTNYNKAMEDSTHIFICDFVNVEIKDENGNDRQFKAFVDGEAYDVTYIDDLMKLHIQLEIYLNKVA